MTFHELSDGQHLPEIGFGTYKLNGFAGTQSILSAVDAGYRLFDTAFNYQNEGTVGQAIQQSHVTRDELIITSKLLGKYYSSYQDSIDLIQESLYRSKLDYFDLYLLHWPNPIDDHYLEAWHTLIQAQKFGLVKSIGVCNFLPEHIERLKKETNILPVVNQVELHPYFNQQELREYNNTQNILTQAWSPLVRASAILKDPVLVELAKKYHKNIGQLVLKWEISLGVLPIPKASSYARQKGNLDLFDFEISSSDMQRINDLTKPDGRTNNQDPAVYQEF
ncbi:aldo/keto reductase [Leuconostoc mesenteroides]|uniref:aldo/keto reductase n=1 Tax=Leuconostoc mesenteroides TaxID=1245 RepID=UPI00065E1761|nr:aldo/keto reductase [Leuconostoc mesenteroides]AKP36772.1 2,5-diketo-D-gluconic acid reductase [Leuconostoc mesenteroides subsp. dextranicum]MBZ1509297.1 aldo/keto reductase [Leuconostoc mesenteroides]MBZ1510158.1 aldo/keto reductase [Leuconostoc mesenteroides]MBZ1512266.1 aldo/keto reductase [Leuconostoc mesenteroides]MBZ1529333.1 aldo/keto reductase [Leuconostoc mesenteroides]